MEILIFIPITILFLVSITFIISKKGVKKSNEIQITPPEDMNPLELAYVYNKKVSTSDVISLIPYLVDKGYIKMEFPFEKNYSDVSNFRIIKNKEYDGNNALERYILNRLFEKSDAITYEELCNDIEYKALFAFCTEVVNSDRNYSIIFNKAFKFIKKIINLLVIIGLFIYDCIFNINYILIYFVQLIMLNMISGSVNGNDIGMSIGNSQIKLKKNNIKITIILIITLLAFSCIMLTKRVNQTIITKSREESIIYLTGILIFACISVIKSKIVRRNKYGEKLYQKILQFRDFLKLTPRESIEAQFNNNKDCYFDIFSYCFVLDMSDKCISEYDKFFNNVYRILYESVQVNNINNNDDYIEANNMMREYNKSIKLEHDKFIQMLDYYQDNFLGLELNSNDIKVENHDLNNGNIFSYAIKALKKWILES